MRVLLAGASGFLGRHLARHLSAGGHRLSYLVRRPPHGDDEIRWDPSTGRLGTEVPAGYDLVVNLAGAGVGDRRWTEEYKRTLRSSRVDSTATLARTLAAMPAGERPATLVNASAVGWYGDTGDRPVTEKEPAGTGFFPDLCRDWEAATGPAEQAGVRVVRLRTGLPLDARGGLLKPLLLVFKAGVGGKLGDGRQYMPWIAMADWLAAVDFLIARPEIAGPVNVTAPNPATNAEFTAAMGRVLHRPTLLPVPRVGLRVVAGEFGGEATASQRVIPAVLQRAGFDFQYPDLEPALRAALAG
jgi:uncharacterized protein (TIGR01777 family)